MTLVRLISSVLLAIGLVEGGAYWWMNPAPVSPAAPVLIWSQGSGRGPLEPGAPLLDPGAKTQVHFSYTDLPEIYTSSAPFLRCNEGRVMLAEANETLRLHLAFFEWDRTDDDSVLEAYKHLPDQCLGSIGMVLIEHRPPRFYPIGDESLTFGHMVFRDPHGSVVHSFKATWVSGSQTLLAKGMRGGGDQWRQLRLQAALKRFRPAHSRVVQGAVRGITDPDRAWQAFEQAMLCDLRLEEIAKP